MSSTRRLAALLVVLTLVLVTLLFKAHPKQPEPPVTSEIVATTSISTSEPTSTTATANAATATSTPTSSPAKKAEKTSIQATKTTPLSVQTTSPNDIHRIENPYATPPLQFETVNTDTRAALVNIICMTSGGGSLPPISGSGVIVDPKGIVLTNAHVAQYVLIAQSGKTDLACTVRSGAPAQARWNPVVIYMPAAWVAAHAGDIVKDHPLGTGEHDYALLYLRTNADGYPVQGAFPSVSPDTREAIAFVDDQVLAAAYPVEFLGGGIIAGELYPLSSYTTVKALMTFTVGKADVLALGGVLEAQSGASGGAVVNQWDRLVGLITTTSEGNTTGARDLHAVTASYIDRDLTALTGRSLAITLSQDPEVTYEAFLPEAARLQQKFFDVILAER